MERAEAQGMCICPQCPTYFDCDEPLAFCHYEEGASSCIKVRNGCICGGCPVQKADGNKWSYYCIEGNAKSHGATHD